MFIPNSEIIKACILGSWIKTKEIEDLKKAMWYLQRKIKLLKNKN